jgi:hypothetical protein
MEQIKFDLTKMDPVTKRLLASTVLNAVQDFYKDPNNIRRFEEWKKEREKQND